MKFLKNNKKAAFLCAISSIFLSACSQLPVAESRTSVPASEPLVADTVICKNGQTASLSGACELHGLDQPVDIWRKLPKSYQLNQQAQNPRVQELLEWYVDNPRILQKISERSRSYLYYIADRIHQRGLPAELALLPAVESSYDPFAYSPGRASGLWQFVPNTARHVGLKQSWWYDGRRDIVASTEAALDYLEALNKRFDGDWLLTLAAYNSGGGTVSRAIQKNKRQGKSTDYWSLPLPKETQRYVPKLLAMSQLIARAGEFGLELPEIPDEPYFQAVDIGGQLDLARAAELAGTSIDEIYRLNPGFNRWATDPSGPHRLLIPVSNLDAFQTGLAAIPASQRINWERYTVKPGDSLIHIARLNHTDVSTIKASNNIKNNLIKAGQVLLLPTASQGSQQYRLSADQRLASAQASGKKAEKVQVFHVVEFGDSLWTLSRKYNVSVRELSKWNNLAARDTIRPGQRLAVWVNRKTGSSSKPATSPYEIIRKIGYTVRNGDSLARIAGRFNVNIGDIAKWNTINPTKYLHPGQRLTLYIDVTRTSLP